MGREQRQQWGAGLIDYSSFNSSLVQDSSAKVEVSSLLWTATPPAVDRRDLQGMGEGSEGV